MEENSESAVLASVTPEQREGKFSTALIVAKALRRQARALVGASYKYRPLDPSQNQIRLLRLAPSNDHSPSVNTDIRATLVHVCLDNPPAYTAISYRWEANNDAAAIRIDGQVIKVSRTLKAALRQLRHQTETQVLWVDAMCINQKDNAERSEQVSMMRDVYSRAAEVVVWLGEGSSTSRLVFPLILDLYEHLGNLEHLGDVLLDHERRQQWQALMEMLDLDYWTRIWVIQEVNSARRKTLRWGRDSMQWEHLAAVQNQINFALGTVGGSAFSVGHSLNLWNKVYQRGPRILNMPDTNQESVGPPELYDLLNFFDNHYATDSRDIIYALVGLSKARNDPRMMIDYSQSVHQVYFQAVDYVLQQQGRLHVICNGPFVPENILRLPSWVRDWNTNSYRFSSLMYGRNKALKDFQTSQNLSAEASIDKNQGILHARGFSVDSVRVVGDAAKSRRGNDFESTVVAVFQWYSLSLQYQIANMDEAFSRSLVCDAYYEESTPSLTSQLLRNILGSVTRFANTLLPSNEFPERVPPLAEVMAQTHEWCEDWMSYITYYTIGRRLFISGRGNMGLCPKDYQDGDMIVILLGCAVPILLRPHEGHYEMIGDVFLHGYMYGKGIEELNEGEHQLQTFEIH